MHLIEEFEEKKKKNTGFNLLSKSNHFKKKKKIQISQNMATLGSWVSPVVRPMAFPHLTANFVFSK